MSREKRLQLERITERLADVEQRSREALATLGLSEGDALFQSRKLDQWLEGRDERDIEKVDGLVVLLVRVGAIKRRLEAGDCIAALRHAVEALTTSELVFAAEAGVHQRELSRKRGSRPKRRVGILEAVRKYVTKFHSMGTGFPAAKDILARLSNFEEQSPLQIEVNGEVFDVYPKEDHIFQKRQSGRTTSKMNLPPISGQSPLCDARCRHNPVRPPPQVGKPPTLVGIADKCRPPEDSTHASLGLTAGGLGRTQSSPVYVVSPWGPLLWT